MVRFSGARKSMSVEPYQRKASLPACKQDLARCYGWKFPAHAVRERKPATLEKDRTRIDAVPILAGCSPSTEQWREKNGPPLTSARLRPWHQHSKRWAKREEPQAAQTGAWPLSQTTVEQISRKNPLNHRTANLAHSFQKTLALYWHEFLVILGLYR